MKTRRPLPSRRRGSVLVVAMILAFIIAISLTSYINLATTTLKTATRSFYANSSLDVAEIGIEQAMACFYQVSTGTSATTAWSGWTPTPSGGNAQRIYPSTTNSYPIGPNATAVVRIYVYDCAMSGTPKIIAKSTITPPSGAVIEKYIEVTLASRSLFSNGLVAKNSISWVGHPTADSWNSASPVAGTPYAALVQAANCTVGAVNGSITLGSGGNVYGTAATGASGTTTGGSVHGLGTTVNDTSLIFNDFSASFPAITVPTPVSYNTVASGSVPTVFPGGADVATSGTYYYNFASGAAINATTSISANKAVVFIMTNHSGTDVIKFTGSNTLTIASSSTLVIYTNGNIDTHGNGMVNSGNQCSALQIYGTNTAVAGQSITIGGNGQLYAAVYAPNATVTLQGGGSAGQVSGSIVANTISMNGGTDFHYDEALGSLTTGVGVHVSKWKELQLKTERDAYTTVLNF